MATTKGNNARKGRPASKKQLESLAKARAAQAEKKAAVKANFNIVMATPVEPLWPDVPTSDGKMPEFAKRGMKGPPLAKATTTGGTDTAAPAKAKAPAEPTKPDAPAPAGSIRDLQRKWIAHLEKDGHTPSTVKTYDRAMDLACEFFGADGAVPAAICAKELQSFNDSKLVTQKANGKPKAMPSILQTRRALRMALEWGGALAGKPAAPAKPAAKKGKVAS